MAVHVSDYIRQNYPEYYGWFEYPVDGTVAFCSTHEEWGILGNFGQTPLIVDGVPFYAAESVFQVMKFSDPAARKAVYSLKGLRLKRKATGLANSCGTRPDWGEIIVDALKFCLMTKYEQSEAFRKELARTGSRYIVEVQGNPKKRADTYNAKLTPDGKTWSGPNLMGRLLMELRDNGKLEYSLPADAMSFSDLL